MGIFKPALEEMNKSGLWYRNPEPFSSYLKKHNLPLKNTASSISVDSLCRLDSELQHAGVMVFRLGIEPGQKHSRFALTKAERADMSDYFLIDQQLFGDTHPELFISAASQQALFGFSLLPRFTETSLVSLAVFSGLLGQALRLDNSTSQSAPATGQSTYTFNFRPRSNEKEPVWQHIGSVENKRPLREIALRFMVKICFDKTNPRKGEQYGNNPILFGINIAYSKIECQSKT